MKLAAFAAVATAFSGNALAATIDTGSYTVSYDDSQFGGISGWWWSGSNQGFSFNIPQTVNVDNTQETATFSLPSFTITPDAGYSLSGPIDLKIGSLGMAAYNASASADFSGSFLVDGNTVSIGTPVLTPNTSTTSGVYTVGSLTLESNTDLPGFNSLSLNKGLLTLSASGEFATVFSNGGNTPSQFAISLVVTPVPEPETYAMMLAGLGLLGFMAKRRKSA
jgi:hypothetical protein